MDSRSHRRWRNTQMIYHVLKHSEKHLTKKQRVEPRFTRQQWVFDNLGNSKIHSKNSWKFSEYLFDLKILEHIPQVIYRLSLVLHFSIWATDGPLKNWPLPLDRFLFEFFWSRNFWGSCYSSICFICGIFEFETEPKGLIYYHVYANIANKIVWSFVWRKFSSVGNGEWWDEMKYGQKLSLGMPMSPQEISKRYERQSLGMPPRHPFFIGKNQVTFQYTIFLLLHMLCVFLGASLLLLLVFFCFVCCNKWSDPNKFLLEEMQSIFHCQEHSNFHSYRSMSVLFF
jgi:hypothetical protein